MTRFDDIEADVQELQKTAITNIEGDGVHQASNSVVIDPPDDPPINVLFADVYALHAVSGTVWDPTSLTGPRMPLYCTAVPHGAAIPMTGGNPDETKMLNLSLVYGPASQTGLGGGGTGIFWKGLPSVQAGAAQSACTVAYVVPSQAGYSGSFNGYVIPTPGNAQILYCAGVHYAQITALYDYSGAAWTAAGGFQCYADAIDTSFDDPFAGTGGSPPTLYVHLMLPAGTLGLIAALSVTNNIPSGGSVVAYIPDDGVVTSVVASRQIDGVAITQPPGNSQQPPTFQGLVLNPATGKVGYWTGTTFTAVGHFVSQTVVTAQGILTVTTDPVTGFVTNVVLGAPSTATLTVFVQGP